jgi:hypothetical protein
MSGTLRFTTVRLGTGVISAGEHTVELDVRVLLDSDGRHRVLTGGTLSAPLASLEAAVALAEAPEPRSREAAFVVQWRKEGAPFEPDERACPVCGAPVAHVSRYPRRLCPACVLEATDQAGRPLRFANAELSGGMVAWYADDGAPYAGHECLVRGIPCRAHEQRMGGIAVQPLVPE